MTQSRSSQVPKLPIILLGLMTLMAFGGPFGLKWVLVGGVESGWPPDRPVEWVTLIGVVGLAVGLLAAILIINLRNLKAMKAEAAEVKARAGESA